MFVILVNDGAIHTLFKSKEEVAAKILEMNNNRSSTYLPLLVVGEEEDEDEDGGKLVEVTAIELVEMLLDAGGCGSKVDVYAKGLVEMGDDYISMSVIDLT